MIEIKYLKSFQNSKEGTFIFEDYVYHIIIGHELSAIKIKSKEHTNVSKIMFEELWEKAKVKKDLK